MSYFFILPVFGALLLGLLATGVALRFTRLKAAAPYVFGAAAGAAPGFARANALLVPLLHGVRRIPGGQNAQTFKAVLLAAVVFIGPFAASAIGVAVGVAVGMFAAWRVTRR